MSVRIPMSVAAFAILSGLAAVARGQEPAVKFENWTWRTRIEVRGNYRDSAQGSFPLKFPFPPSFLPPGQTIGFEETVDAGQHFELSMISATLDVGYKDLFAARVKIDGIDLYDRNPTSEDRKLDADELWIRLGPKPEGFATPDGSTLFLQLGKAPKIERSTLRLLESYGLATTAFNRFEDTQALLGGTFGARVYWRAQVSKGNPLFFRDPNALAGDNGVKALLRPFPDPVLKSGFPILYDAEVEGYGLKTDEPEWGGGLGYRWRAEDQESAIDILVFYYRRDLAETAPLHGTFYGGDLDLLDVGGIHLPVRGNERTEAGGRILGEWGRLSLALQYVAQELAGLKRTGYEIEAGATFALALGPQIGGAKLLTSIAPALRFSALDNRFEGPDTFVAPSMWWDRSKLDVGLRLGILDNLDLTLEHAFHDIETNGPEVDAGETLVTLRLRWRGGR